MIIALLVLNWPILQYFLLCMYLHLNHSRRNPTAYGGGVVKAYLINVSTGITIVDADLEGSMHAQGLVHKFVFFALLCKAAFCFWVEVIKHIGTENNL